MIKSLKINTAALICTAFIFRLLFINLGVIASPGLQTSPFKASQKSSRLHTETVKAAGNERNLIYSATDICEEEPDNDDTVKHHPFLVAQVFFSLLIGEPASEENNTAVLPACISKAASPLHLVYRVFRI